MPAARRHCRLVFLLLLSLLASIALGAPTDDEVKAVYRQIIARVNVRNIRNDYEAVAAFGSRIAGSAGEARTFDYVEKQLTSFGAKNFKRTPFEVSVPDPEAIGSLNVQGNVVQVLPLWPNLVSTSTCNVSGPLIYAGNGSLEAMSGLEIRGSIVLLEMGVGAGWKNAAKLGASAVIFIQPDQLKRGDVENKFSAVPLDVPRFFLPLANAAPVLNAAYAHQTVQLACRQDWVRRQSSILSAELPGSDAREASNPIELMAYADSMSVVPKSAPGAEAIGGVAGLLESARIFSSFPHRRTIRFILAGAHFLALQGSREYVERLIESNGEPPLLTISLDISSGSGELGSYGRGWFYEYRDESQNALQSVSRLFRNHADKLADVMGIAPARLVMVDAVNNGDNRTWKNNIPGKFALDCEPMVNAGMNALTFMTVEDSRDAVDTPFDTLERLNLGNVQRQIETLGAMLYHAANDTTSTNESSDYRIPLDPAQPQRMRLIGGFGVASGQVFEYDAQKSFVPDIPVPGTLAVAFNNQKSLMGVRGNIIVASGPKGEYKLIGMAPMTSYSWNTLRETQLGAYRVDAATGKIDYAPSLGYSGDNSYPIYFPLKTGVRTSPIVVFRCVSISLFDLVDPQDLKSLQWVRVLDADTMTNPQDYGEYMPVMDQRLDAEVEDATVLFLKPGQRFILLAGAGPGDSRLIITNSSVGNESGNGYFAPGGPATADRGSVPEVGLFSNLALNSAKDIVAINATRLRKFKKYRIIDPGIVELQGQAEAAIRAADAALAKKDWTEVDRNSRAAWGYALRAHPTIMSTANDVVNGVVFYLFLLIPFSYFLERLLVGSQMLTRQLMWAVGFFIGSFILLRAIHPAFEIVSNPAMIFIAFVMGVLSLIVVSFILGKFEQSLKAVRAQQSGVHEVDIKRSSVAMAAFNLGVSNMRRRKARTILTTLTLVVMTFIVLSFTSIVSDLSTKEYPSDTPARYSGILLRNAGLEPMQLTEYRQIQNEFSGRGSVVRRAAYYGADIGDSGVLTLQRGDRLAEVRSMLGLDPGEDTVLRPQDALLPGGRWFRPGERNVMILPQALAQQLKIESQDVGKAAVTYAGENYTVIGIADSSALRGLVDLDGDNVLPADFSLSRKMQQDTNSGNQAFRSFVRLDPSVVFIVPAATALSLGADLRNIAVAFRKPQDTRDALTNLMPRLRMNLYASVPKAPGMKSDDTGAGDPDLQVEQFSILRSSSSSGIGLVLVQLVIASVFVLNTMIASVYERTKEIAIFSSIGLAPNHIAMLFFAESLVYGILGAVIGYFLAQGTAKIIVATDSLQGLTLNFSSTSAVMSAVIVMGVVLLSTIYPARKASQIAAPAMNDEVFETEPDGDVWELPLPFSISATEAGPVTAFLGEWFGAYEEFTIGDFVTSGTRVQTFSGDHPGSGLSHAVVTTAWLAPYDLGISQNLRLVAAPSFVPGVYVLQLSLTRLSGDPENWPIVNQRFLANLRKQFLTWRTLDREHRKKYDMPIAPIPIPVLP